MLVCVCACVCLQPDQRPDIAELLQRTTQHTSQSPGAMSSSPPPLPAPAIAKADRDLCQREERIREAEERLRAWESALQEKEKQLRCKEGGLGKGRRRDGCHFFGAVHSLM